MSVIVKCDRCGLNIGNEPACGTIFGRIEQARGAADNKIGKYSFATINARFEASDGSVVKVDLCRACVAEIAGSK